LVQGEILPADKSFCLYVDVAYLVSSRPDYKLLPGAVPSALYIEYPDDYLKWKNVITAPTRRKIKIQVWATREGDGSTVRPAEQSYLLELTNELDPKQQRFVRHANLRTYGEEGQPALRQAGIP